MPIEPQRRPVFEGDGDNNLTPQVFETDDGGSAVRDSDPRSMREAASGIIDRLTGLADEAVQKRTPIEERWLEDERAYHGKYDEVTEKNLRNATASKSRAIINLTQPKTNAWSARLGDLLFPADDRNWGINPTPVPELVNEADEMQAQAEAQDAMAEQLVEEHNRRGETGEAQDVTLLPAAAAAGERAQALRAEEAKRRKVMDTAKQRSEAMQREMDDQLTESLYPKRSRDVIDDACRLGVGILKGPLFANRPRRKWVQVEGNVFRLQGPTDDRPEFRRVNPWSFFPDPNGTEMDDVEYTFERHLPNRSKLRKMAKELGFNKEAVRELLREGPGYGTNRNLDHLTHLRSITNEGEAITGRYVVWEYHGVLEKEDICILLHGAGRADDAEAFEQNYDELDELKVVIYFCDGHLLKLSEAYVLDSNEPLYSVFSFLKSEASVLGSIGVPAMMRDPARALSAVWRMMLDNAALSVGPQVVIDKNMVEPEDGSWKLTGRKVWKRTGQDINTQNKPFDSFDIPNNQAELAGIIELALRFVDDVTSLPLIAQGEQASHVTQTANGMAMLFNSANVIFRRVVKNWDDDLTTPAVRRLFDWNMQFNPKDAIKGDMQVEARGTSVLLVREVQSQNLMAITTTWSSHPILGPALKAYDSMRMTLQSLSINPDDVLVPREEYEKKLLAMAEGQAESPELIRAQATVEAAKIGAAARTEAAQVDLQVAHLRYEVEVMKLRQTGEITAAQMTAMLDQKRLELGSQERMKAVDIAVEERRAERARAEGQSEEAAVGQGVG